MTDLSIYQNKWYKPGSAIKRALWYITSILFFQNSLFPFYKLKVFILRCFGAEIGTGVLIKPKVNIKYPWFLKTGNHIWIGENVWIDNLGLVILGSNVCISQGAFLLTGNHDFKKSTFDLMVKPVTIGDGAWIGAKTVVCPGVHCFENSILTVGSIATANLQQNGIYQGNPAVLIKTRS